MAIWADSTINTDELTQVFNQVFNRKFIDNVSEKKGLLEVVLGKPSPNPDGAGKKPFQRMKKISGSKIEVKLLGNYASIGTLADGAAEVASTVGAVVQKYGAAEFSLTHFNHQHWVPKSEYDRFRGDEAKTVSFIQDEYDWLMASWAEELASGISSTNDQQRVSLGGWEYAVTNDNVYGTINRNDAANVDFRGYEKDTFGAFTLDKLQTEYTVLKKQEAKPDILIGNQFVYNQVVKHLRDEGTLQYTYGANGQVAAGGATFNWQGMDLILDPHTTETAATDGTLGMLESKSFAFYLEDKGMSPSAIVDTSKKSALLINLDGWAGFICTIPKHNGKMNTVQA